MWRCVCIISEFQKVLDLSCNVNLIQKIVINKYKLPLSDCESRPPTISTEVVSAGHASQVINWQAHLKFYSTVLCL